MQFLENTLKGGRAFPSLPFSPTSWLECRKDGWRSGSLGMAVADCYFLQSFLSVL